MTPEFRRGESVVDRPEDMDDAARRLLLENMNAGKRAKAAHTPVPWETGCVMTSVEVRPKGWNASICIADCHTQNAPKCETERVANARFIVRACNSHEALEHALQALLDWGREHTSPRDANSPHALLVAAVAALELARK